jgi:type III restriction enzyme
MELKSYQQDVLNDLNQYFEYIQKHQNYAKAYNMLWEDRLGTDYDPLTGKGIRPYRDTIQGCPHVCVKVPTAGGKTFIAVNALKTIFDNFERSRPKAVVWLVPWSNLLDQTYQALNNPEHPYRQRLNALFSNRIEVYEKKDLLQAASFDPANVSEQLSIFILSYGSLRAKNKDDRKVFEENSALAKFAQYYTDDNHLLADVPETALINVIRSLTPVVVVDESHNAESDLSVEMLQNLNPSFIFDLTATPKNNANIISFVPALKLKANNMVKLPVIAYNHRTKNEVIDSALHLQRQLETIANQEQRYIRPIVLFQAQPKTKDDNVTFEKIKQELLALQIPENQIKIKTATINELKGVDLMNSDCEVRYIITVNALKEGWDCPFAYILASVADRSSEVDVTQILGRVLRQPYVAKHQNHLLNVSYVLTASDKFTTVLNSIVQGLEMSGYSKDDYRAEERKINQESIENPIQTASFNDLLETFISRENTGVEENIQKSEEPINAENQASKEVNVGEKNSITFDPTEAPKPETIPPVVNEIAQQAIRASEESEQKVAVEIKAENSTNLSPEMKEKSKYYTIKEDFKEIVETLKIPQFRLIVNGLGAFSNSTDVLLSQEELIKGLDLSKENTEITWENSELEMYSIDLEKTKGTESVPKYLKVDTRIQQGLKEYILAKPKEAQVRDLVFRFNDLIGNMYPIPDSEIKTYLQKVIEGFKPDQIRDLLERQSAYKEKFKQKIQGFADAHASKMFRLLLDKGKIIATPTFSFPEVIVPKSVGAEIGKSLYEKEAEMNLFETEVIGNIASLDNVVFWHRNLGRGKGFYINGFMSNHYPDFIIYTKSKKIILLETKGEMLDNPETKAKNKLGMTWEKEANKQHYRYMMIFKNESSIEDAYTVKEAIELLRDL